MRGLNNVRTNMKHANNFTFAMELAKAFGETNDEGQPTRMSIKGVASNTRKDKDNHRMTMEGLTSIQKAIEEGLFDDDGEWDYVPLLSGHKSEWEDKLGSITKAEIDDQENLWITAELDPDSTKARELFIKVSKGNAVGRKPQLGLSVKGKATKYRFGLDPETQERVTYLDNVVIEEVSVTSKPKNPTPYPLAIAKSLTYPTEEPMETDTNELDPIAKAVQKAQEARESEPVVTYSDGTEGAQPAQAAPQVAPVAQDANVVPQPEQVPAAQSEPVADANPTTAEAEALSAEQADAANHQRTEGVAAVPAVPEGYAVHPAQAAAAAEAAPQDVATQPEAAAAPAADSTVTQDILRQLDELRAMVERLATPEVQKAETVTTPATSVALDSSQLAQAVALAVSKALEDTGLSKVSDEMAVIKSTVEALQNTPVDKSISVSKAKTEDESDPYAQMKALREKGIDPITAAMNVAFKR
jgi:hypothetical protein